MLEQGYMGRKIGIIISSLIQGTKSQEIIKFIFKNLFSLQKNAKETLELLSNSDRAHHWYYSERLQEPKSMELKSKHTIQLIKQRNRPSRVLTSHFTEKNINKNTLPSRQILFQQCPNTLREGGKSLHYRKCKKKKQMGWNFKPLNNQGKSLLDKQIEGVDFMKFWVRHRFEDKSVNSLVNRIQQKRRKIRELRF